MVLRRGANKVVRAVFFDKDGTLVDLFAPCVAFLSSVKKIRSFPGDLTRCAFLIYFYSAWFMDLHASLAHQAPVKLGQQ